MPAESIDTQTEPLIERVDMLERENKILREEVALLKKWRFGRSSERIELGQLDFFGPGEASEKPTVVASTKKSRSKDKKAGHGRSAFPEHLEREVHRHELETEERACPECGECMPEIRVDVTERGHYVPAKLIVIRDERPVYACAQGHTAKSAPLPDAVIDRGKYCASVYANIATAKYQDHSVPRRHAHRPQGRMGVPRCTEDEGWPLGIGVQALVSNHLESFELRARAGSVERKGTARLCQVRSMETNASEPLITCREVFKRRQNRAGWSVRDESRGYLLTDWSASGMKVA